MTCPDISPDKLPPAPTNFIEPKKRPLSSMTPIIITKDDHLIGVIGGSGGMNIIPAVIQVFMNHFIFGMEPLDAVQSPRIYHKGWNSLDTVVAAESLALTLQASCNLKDSKELLERCLNARKVLLPDDHIQIGANLLHLAQVAMLDSSQHKKRDVERAKAELDIAKDDVHSSISCSLS